MTKATLDNVTLTFPITNAEGTPIERIINGDMYAAYLEALAPQNVPNGTIFVCPSKLHDHPHQATLRSENGSGQSWKKLVASFLTGSDKAAQIDLENNLGHDYGQPLTKVTKDKKGKFTIASGHMRTTAQKHIKKNHPDLYKAMYPEGVPVQIVGDNPLAANVLSLVHDHDRADKRAKQTPFEIVSSIAYLCDTGKYDVAAIAAMRGSDKNMRTQTINPLFQCTKEQRAAIVEIFASNSELGLRQLYEVFKKLRENVIDSVCSQYDIPAEDARLLKNKKRNVVDSVNDFCELQDKEVAQDVQSILADCIEETIAALGTVEKGKANKMMSRTDIEKLAKKAHNMGLPCARILDNILKNVSIKTALKNLDALAN